MKSEEHVHKYRKFRTPKGKYFWRCMEPGCSHVLYDKGMVLGRMHHCWSCENSFTLQTRDLEAVKPKCADCRERAYIMKGRMKMLRENFLVKET